MSTSAYGVGWLTFAISIDISAESAVLLYRSHYTVCVRTAKGLLKNANT
jgi:hypothetical protein